MWGPELKFAGFDAILIKGKADRPVYLWIKDGKAELRDASHLWGQLAAETHAMIRTELGDNRIRIALIGPGGEKLVRFACISNELKHFNGRVGLGAVMGSKNLKAIAVRGEKKMPLFAPEKARGVVKEVLDIYKKNPGPWVNLNCWPSCPDAGGILTRNFVVAVWPKKAICERQQRYDLTTGPVMPVLSAAEVKDDPQADPPYGGPGTVLHRRSRLSLRHRRS
jgi:hypothetical protein